MAQRLLREVRQKGSLPHLTELQILKKDGESLWIETTASLLNEPGLPPAIQGIARDVTHRRRMREGLTSQAEFERLITGISTRFINVVPEDIDGAIEEALRSIGTFSGVDRSYVFLFDTQHTRLIETHVWRKTHPRAPVISLENLTLKPFAWARQRLEGSQTIHIPRLRDLPKAASPERKALEAEGIRSLILVPMTSRDNLVGVVGFASLQEEQSWSGNTIALLKIVGEIFVNALERKRIEENLRESTEMYRQLTEAAREIIITVDLSGRITFANRACLELTGFAREDLIGANLTELLPEHILQLHVGRNFRDLAKQQGFRLDETEIFRKDRSLVPLEVSIAVLRKNGRPAGILFTARDITERRKAEEEKRLFENRLRQSQKLEAIGTLAGGIAHDFNNILSAIINYSELLKDNLPEGSIEHTHLTEVLKAGDRASDLIKQILTFSRQMESEREPVPMNLILKESLGLIRASLPTTIEIVQDITADCGSVLADPSHIQQLVMNLCTNAYHAMESGRGILGIALKPVEITADTAESHPSLQKGRYVRLTVSDTGKGMDHQTKERIFDPFFTTKGKNKGTGLGLAMVHGIVTSLKGAITVFSEPGMGSTFNVFLPRIEGASDTSSLTEEVIPTGSGERILLVDDEPPILKSSKQLLERLGYQVDIVERATEALRLFSADPELYDLVITDQTMPTMTGIELARILMDIRPDIPVILCTGFSETITEETASRAGIRDFILKPVAKGELARSIRKVIAPALATSHPRRES